MQPLPVAVVGCGLFGDIHVTTYAHFDQSDLVLVCDLDEKRAKATAEKFGCDYTTRVEDVADDKRVKAVSVVTPEFAHRDPCVMLAKSGKHIMVEKPLATSTEDAQAIVQAVKNAGVVGAIDFHNRYHPAFRAFQRRRFDGELGDVKMIFARLSDRLEVATQWFGWSGKSGPQWFLGSHLVDTACWLMDAEPVRVYADATKGVLSSQGIDCYDCVQIHLSFPGGMAVLETSWILPDSWPSVADFSVSIQTSTSRVDVQGSDHGMVLARPHSYRWPFLNGLMPIDEDDWGYFNLPIKDFVRAVNRGKDAPVSVEVGLKNVQIIEAALQSIEQHRVIELV